MRHAGRRWLAKLMEPAGPHRRFLLPAVIIGGIVSATLLAWFAFGGAKDSRWYLWIEAGPFNRAVNCETSSKTPAEALAGMNDYSRRARENVSPTSPTQSFIVNYQLLDKGEAGLVIETIPPGVATGHGTPHYFQTKDTCIAFAQTQKPH